MTGPDDSLTGGIIGACTLFALVWCTSALTHRFDRAKRVLEGEPRLMVSHGRFLERNMNLERIQPDEIYSEMRKAGLAELSRVRWAVLEPDGQISFVPMEMPDKPVKKREPVNM